MIPRIEEAVAVIRAGGVVGFPTDTVYGIGVDPHSEEAVSRLYEIKGRPPQRPIGVLAASLDQASLLADIAGTSVDLARAHWPGALTLVVTSKVALPEWVGDSNAHTVGVRVPDHPIALELLEAAGPLAVTSANLSGETDSLNQGEARAIFGEAIHYVPGESPGGSPSTVVDMTGPKPVVLRHGPVVLASG